MSPIPQPLPDERQASILARLTREGRVLAVELARAFNTSEDTIRRDLRDLAAAGLCRRVYGGALRISPASGPVRVRATDEIEAKTALGVAAAALVGAGQTVVIESGSTNLCIARALPDDRRLTVVTNAPPIAAALFGRPRIEVIVIGGRIDPRVGASFGPRALRDLADIQADIAFIGACAVAANGLCAFDAEEAEFKRLLVAQAAQSVTAMTTSKLSTVAPFRFATLDALSTLVVEADAPESLVGALDLPPARVLRAAPLKNESRP